MFTSFVAANFLTDISPNHAIPSTISSTLLAFEEHFNYLIVADVLCFHCELFVFGLGQTPYLSTCKMTPF